MNLFEFLHELFIAKIRVLGLSDSEDFAILACFVFTQQHRGPDKQTDGKNRQNPLISFSVPTGLPRVAKFPENRQRYGGDSLFGKTRNSA